MIALETRRLLLRPVAASDFADVHRLHTDAFVAGAIFGGQAPSRRDTRRRMQHYLRDWQRHGFGFFAVLLKSGQDGDVFVGRAGLRYFEDTSDVEYGHCFFGHAAGRGIGPEAGRAVLDFAFCRLKVHRIVAVVRAENERGVRAVEKIGFKHADDRIHGDGIKCVFVIHGPESATAGSASRHHKK
ncbi:GNAT family N-acetyltransferase [Chelativorans salis]|uniref:GNAT family N-acetyltransferase n=1 Tax=Chelativorans salis TaxID=2978478 RepID=A0ABT2LXD4_9HYPH|nr:GNAT family N-acetyltransferase [Chelativorans sp. EGI FJ00035]MCT7378253.1 GNAT family N-acetyltransferase [Chelativorans sp. EGI FJ00035]